MSTMLSKSIFALYLEGQHIIPTRKQLICYIVFMVISFFCVILAIRISLLAGTFHRNLKRILLCALVIWLENCLSKCLVLTAQLKFYNFPKKEFSPTGLELVRFSAFFRYHWSYYFCSIPFCILIERSLATYYVADYEKKKRKWIFLTLFFASFSLAVLMSGLAVCEKINTLVLMLHIFSINIISLFGFLYLYFYNKQKFNRLELHDRKAVYTLSIKYQLRENLLILESMRFFMGVITIAICIVLTTMIIPVILEIPADQMWIMHAIPDYLFHFYPIYLIPAHIICLHHNRLFFLRMLSQNFGIGNPRPSTVTMVSSSNDGDVYFNMFQKSISTSDTSGSKPRRHSAENISKWNKKNMKVCRTPNIDRK